VRTPASQMKPVLWERDIDLIDAVWFKGSHWGVYLQWRKSNRLYARM